MANSEEQPLSSRGMDDVETADENFDGGNAAGVYPDGGATSEAVNPSVTRRLTEIFVADGDGDLLLQSCDRDGGCFQWLRALDMQVMGACRTDERLKPLLKLNVSAGVAEDNLLAHLSQHFEPSEVGLLARCLCVPLVSIRVGKIDKQEALMSPTSIRVDAFRNVLKEEERLTRSVSFKYYWGNLCLTLLPTSDLRVSFNGDDGSVEKLATLSTKVQSGDVVMEEIPADKSGRSFLIKTPDNVVSYFWCSEKSKLLGDELIAKMKDLLVTKPSLAELTGISESRLSYFASDLRAYLTDAMLSNAQASGMLSANPADKSANSSDLCSVKSSDFPKSVRFQQYSSSKGSKNNLIYLGSLSPKSSSFKDDLQKSSSSLRSATSREKPRRRRENYTTCVGSQSLASSIFTFPSNPTCFTKDKITEVNGSAHSPPALTFLDRLDKYSNFPVSGLEMQIPSSPSSPPFSPQYCWCPPVASALQYTIGNPKLPIVSAAEPFSLPPLSSLLPSSRPSPNLLLSKPLLNVAELSTLSFPGLPSEPIVRLPTSQQMLTFTPLVCDPIVHVPVIDVCSSSYLATSLPSGESAVEKGARETLRMLISGSSNRASTGEQTNMFGGIYNGTRDVVASVTAATVSVGLVLFSENSVLVGDDLVIDPSGPVSSGLDEGTS